MSQRVLVCGGREYHNWKVIRTYLSRLSKDTVIVHGGARGADSVCATVAEEIGFQVEPHPVLWEKYGRGAGFIRNQEMLDTGIDLVIAFPGGKGTADMVRRAHTFGVQVWEVPA